MLDKSRMNIYNYLYNLFYNVVTKNVYTMIEPQELTESDAKDGFVVIHVGSIADESEFGGTAYGQVRCYVQAYVPPISRGRLDRVAYKAFEDGINDVIANAISSDTGDYTILDGSVISTDIDEISNANNAYFTFIRSFIVLIDKPEN